MMQPCEMNSQAIICRNKGCFLVHKPVLQQTGDCFINQKIANLTLKVKPLHKWTNCPAHDEFNIIYVLTKINEDITKYL